MSRPTIEDLFETSDRVRILTGVLAAASTATTDGLRLLYLAEARGRYTTLLADVLAAGAALESMEAEVARKPYVAKEE